MIRSGIAPAWTLVIALATSATSAVEDPLTIGNPAPKLDVKTFLLGEPVKELKKGTIYVVEFSGTQCTPCIKYIPKLTELQKKYKDIVVISVYSGEEEKDVRNFLPKHQDKIGFRVATDPDGRVWKAWFEAAILQGIPNAFIVDASGAIAWIGYPWDMAEPLDQIVSGKFDPKPHMVRLKFEQAAFRKIRLDEQREEEASKAYESANELVIAGKLDEALADVEKALKKYSEAKHRHHLLLSMKCYILFRMPGKKEAAIEFAIEFAVAAKLSQNALDCTDAAENLLRFCEESKERELAVVGLATALLKDTLENLRFFPEGRDPAFLLEYEIEIKGLLAKAHHLRGDHILAVSQMEEAIALLKSQKAALGEDPEKFKKSHDKAVEWYTKQLTNYRKAAGSPPKKP